MANINNLYNISWLKIAWEIRDDLLDNSQLGLPFIIEIVGSSGVCLSITGKSGTSSLALSCSALQNDFKESKNTEN